VPRRLRLSGVLLMLAVLVPGCVYTGDSPRHQEELQAAITREVPEVRVTDFRVFTGLGTPAGFSVTVLGPPATPDQARARTRKVARTVWFTAPQRLEQFTVMHAVPDRAPEDCAMQGRVPPGGWPCWVDRLDMPTDAANALWGPAHGHVRLPYNAGRSCQSGPEVEALGPHIDWPGVPYDSPDVRVRVAVRDDVDRTELLGDGDKLAALVWRCHPARVVTVSITLQAHVPADTAPGTNIAPPDSVFVEASVEHTAGELRTRFGQRPADLPQ
jgi:hypothetical protein